MKHYIIIIIIAMSNYCYGFDSIKQPYFSGEIKNNELLKVDSVRIAFFENYLGGSYGVKLQTIRVDKQGNFEFRCPGISKPARLNISIYHAGRGHILNNYIIEPADHVHLEVIKSREQYAVKFSGAGSAKYNLIDQLVAQNELIIGGIVPLQLNKPYNIPELALKLKQLDSIIVRAEKEKSLLISSYSGIISTTMQRLLKHEYGPNFSNWDTRLYQLHSEIYARNDSIKALIINHFQRNKNRMCHQTDSTIYISHAEVAFLLEREKLSLYFNKKGASIQLDTFYNILSAKYKEEMRDHLLARIFLFPRFLHPIIDPTSSRYDSLLSDAHHRISTPYLKEVLSHKFKAQKGNKLNKAEFTDLQGKPFNVESLTGKVFLLDIWGEGCTGCAIFHEKFMSIAPIFKENPAFTCLSISIDKTREKWLEGIESGKFTSKEHINVYTSGLGGKHPFLQYYQISAIPFLILVDRNGYIYEKLDVSISPERLKELIYRALKENSTK